MKDNGFAEALRRYENLTPEDFAEVERCGCGCELDEWGDCPKCKMAIRRMEDRHEH